METSDALPLLAFALRELYDRFHENGAIKLDDYRRAIGNLPSAVAQRAADLLADCERRFGASGRFTPAQSAAVKAAFLALVGLTDEAAPTRRRARWTELPVSVHPVMKAFSEARLLTEGASEEPAIAGGASAAPYLEVAHEAVFRSWKDYREWIERYGALLAWRKRTEAALVAWRASRSPRDLLEEEYLSEAMVWLRDAPELLSHDEQVFIRAGDVRRRRRRSLEVVSVLLAFVVVASVALYMRSLQTEAKTQASVAQKRAREARTVAMLAVERGHTDAAVRAALLREIPAPGPLQWWQAALDATQRSKGLAVLRPLDGAVVQVAFTRDGSKLLTLGRNHVLVLSDISSGRSQIIASGILGTRFALSPSGQLLLATDTDVYIGSLDAPQLAKKAVPGEPRALAFPDDEHAMVACGRDSETRLANVLGSGPPIPLPEMSAFAVGIDGSDIYWGTYKNKIWKVGKKEPFWGDTEDDGWVEQLTTCHSALHTRVLSLHNNYGGDSEFLRIADLQDKRESRNVRAAAQVAAFSPDCERVAYATNELVQIVDYWGPGSPPIRLEGHTTSITSIAFDASGKRLATASEDGAVRIWSTAKPDQPARVSLADGDLERGLGGSPGGRFALRRAIGFGVAPLVLAEPGVPGRERPVPTTELAEIAAFSPTAETLATAGDVGLLGKHGRVSVFQTQDLKLINRSLDVPGLTALAVNDTHVVAGTAKGSLSLARLDGSPAISLSLGNTAITALALAHHPDRIIAGFRSGEVKSVALDGSNVVSLKAHLEMVLAIAVGNDGAIATAVGTKVHVVTAEGKQVVLADHIGNVRSIAFSSNSKKLVTSAGDGLLRVWNVDGNGSPVTLPAAVTLYVSMNGMPTPLNVPDVAFSADGKRVLSFGYRELQIWTLDARTVLWRQGSPCLTAEVRSTLLGGSLEDALPATKRCEETLATCRRGFDDCEKAVRASYDTD